MLTNPSRIAFAERSRALRKLTDEQVLEIRQHYFYSTMKRSEMARHYGVDRKTITRICKFITYDD